MPKDMLIQKSVIINKPSFEVYEYLRYSAHQNEFSVWNMADPNQKITSIGTDGQVGYIYSWDSDQKNVGAGSQEIINLIDGQQIEYKLDFKRPMKNTAFSKFVIQKISDNKTEVSWDFRGPTKFPMSLFTFILKRILGKDIATSLENLKVRLEKA